MKAIMVMFDSLNRHMLPPYGCDWVHAPNFSRLAERTLVFENSYICSMPCMPARRDLHTGRPNFLHRSWGPLEPFDDSVPRILRRNGISSHLCSDHYHYWETGGATYHTQYSTWQFFRGQEGDPWMGQAADPPAVRAAGRNAEMDGSVRQDLVNRRFMRSEADQPQSGTFAAGIDFIRRNHAADDWFLQIETFDPHEPFFTQRHYQDLYPDLMGERDAPLFDWPFYRPLEESGALADQCRGRYAALLSMCDARLGDVLDEMDRCDLWRDTMLIVWTDHGFLLGEHDWWGKMRMPWYEELAHTPFFVWDPRCAGAGERRRSLVQPSIDLGPTLLDFFGLEPSGDMLGAVLRDALAGDVSPREDAIFGLHGAHVNITDGRYVYMRAPASAANEPLFNYTLMPAHMGDMFEPGELAKAELASPFAFSKGCPLLQVPRTTDVDFHGPGNLLFDLEKDPRQRQPINDAALERHLAGRMVELMQACSAPREQFERLGLAC